MTSIQSMMFLILAQALVAVSIVCAKFLVGNLPIVVILCIRFAIAALILLPLHWLSPAKQFSLPQHFSQLTKTDWLFIVAQAVCAGVLFNWLMVMGLEYTDANIAGIITSALPALIAIMSWLLLKEKITARSLGCIVLATLGLIIIAGAKTSEGQRHNSLLGDFLVFASLLPEASYYILSKLHVNKLPIFLVASLLNGINAVILILLFLVIQPDIHGITFQNWMILTFLGLTSGLFYVFWFFGCQKVEGIKASLTTAVMPVATVIFAWLLLGEQLTAVQMAGMSLVVLSIVANGH